MIFNVLAIDPGGSAGVCLDDADGALRIGTVKKASERASIVAHACHVAELQARPLVVAAENWNPQGWKNPGFQRRHGDHAEHGFSSRSILGMGATWGWWEQAIDERKTWRVGRRTFPKTIRVFPEQWRRATLGRARPPRAKAEELTRERARRFLVRQIERGREIVGELDTPDAEAACCIYLWAKQAPQVFELLGLEPPPEGRT